MNRIKAAIKYDPRTEGNHGERIKGRSNNEGSTKRVYTDMGVVSSICVDTTRLGDA